MHQHATDESLLCALAISNTTAAIYKIPSAAAQVYNSRTSHPLLSLLVVFLVAQISSVLFCFHSDWFIFHVLLKHQWLCDLLRATHWRYGVMLCKYYVTVHVSFPVIDTTCQTASSLLSSTGSSWAFLANSKDVCEFELSMALFWFSSFVHSFNRNF